MMPESTDKRSAEKGANVRKSVRQRPLPPEVNARNLAIEKQRREVMNENFQSLARLIPAIDAPRKSSKASIVKETIRHLQQQREMCIAAANDLQPLLAENKRLVAEVNAFRAQLGGQALEPMKVTEAMSQLIAFKDRVQNESPQEFSDHCVGGTPESGIDTGFAPVVSDGGTELPAMNLQHPQVQPKNGLLTAAGEIHHLSSASAPHVHDFWNMSLPSEPDFGALQIPHTGESMIMHDPVLEAETESLQQDCVMGEMSTIYEEHGIPHPDYHLDPMSSTHPYAMLSGFAT